MDLEKTILRKVGDAIGRFRMIREGDCVAVGVSGGKDSLALLEALLLLQKRAPIQFTVRAFTIEQGKFLAPIQPVGAFLKARGVDWTYVQDNPSLNLLVEQPGHGCDVCSRFRRRAVYEVARGLGANVVAFGHTADDFCEAFLRNAMFTGRVAALPPVTWSRKHEFRLIRPLVFVNEQLTREFAAQLGAPIIPCGCSQKTGTVRRSLRDMFTELEKEHPFLKETLLSAMGNIETSRMLDTRFLDLDSNSDDSDASASELVTLGSFLVFLSATLTWLAMVSPELIIINGPNAGSRYPLGQGEFVIGRAPNSSLVLPESEVGWRHCQIRAQGQRFLVTDLKSSSGTYVNGMRSAERWLEEKDQIGVGKTIVMFRSGEADTESAGQIAADTKPALLAACSLLFLFRALASSEGDKHVLQTQILRLIGDLIPNSDGILLIGASPVELTDRYEQQTSAPQQHIVAAISHVCEEGAFEDAASGLVAVPLYLSGGLFGALLVNIHNHERSHFAAHLETLTAVSALASVGFEANREVEILRAENKFLAQQIAPKTGMVGESPLLRRLLDRVERVAPHDTTVLITGESGTGKELVARALHEKSNRRDRPFIAVNCAALSETLFESELFGHEKGAFTGAIAMKPGLFELAQGGTIFLDEVGELAQGFQAKFLRVLQQREFFRVGGTQARPLDIRVVAATNRDLGQDVSEGRFREDLFHRLNVVALDSPPLRERKEDIPALAQYFLQRSAERSKRHVKGLSPEALEMIMQYSWPGNVRELENAMERAVVLGDSDWVVPEDLPDALLAIVPQNQSSKYEESIVGAKREAILDAYKQAKGDYRGAAKILNLHPNYLLRLVRNLRLRDEINRLKGQ